MTPFPRRILSVLLVFAALAWAAPAVAIDLLEQPAVQSGAATRTLILDITRKGNGAFAAVGSFGVIVISEDGGTNWEQASVPASVVLTAVHFPTPELGWAVGHDGLILHSSDGGATWEKQLDGYALNDQIIEVAERIVAHAQERLDALLADENADEYDIEDAEFELEEAGFMLEGAMDDTEAGPVRPLLDVLFLSESEGYVVGSYGMLLHTTNAGANWSLVSDRMNNPGAFHLNQIKAAPDGNLFIAAESGLVFRSSDGGLSWDSFEPGYPGSWYGLVVVPDEAGSYELLVYGLQGHVYRSTDKGESWQAVAVGTQVTLTTGALLSDGSVILAGHGGTMLVRAPGQSQFVQAENPDRRVITAIEQKSNGNLIKVGLGGIRLARPDGTPLANGTDHP